MRDLVRYLAGYALDSFRERVTGQDFRDAGVRRLLVVPGPGGAKEAARRLFPGVEVSELRRPAGLWEIRRGRFDAVLIPMAGGGWRNRILGLLSGARHKVLVPSPDYCYRLGMRRGPPVLLWTIVDRFLVAPLALAWLALAALWLHTSGVAGRAREAETLGRPPAGVLLIRLLPADQFLALLRRVRERWPQARVSVMLASAEGEAQVRAAADEAICTSGMSAWQALRRVRAAAADLVLLAGGAAYAGRPTLWKGLLAARLSGARVRRNWEVGDDLAGRPLGEVARRELAGAPRRLWARGPGRVTAALGRLRARRAYRRRPRRGPELVQVGITAACNYHCLMCPFHNPAVDPQHRESELPRLSWEAFARLLGDLRRMGTEAVDICGSGEPLVHPDGMDMIGLARELGFRVTLATNAALLTEERARHLVDIGLLRMHVSINAGTPATYAQMHPGAEPATLERIVGRLREMAEYADAQARRRVEVEYSAVLTRLNMGEIVEMVRAAAQARAAWFMLIQMGRLTLPPSEELNELLLPRSEDWPAVRRQVAEAAALAAELGIQTNLEALLAGASEAGTRSVYERVPCYMGHDFALVLADGRVFFCCHCSRPLGDLREEGFAAIWNSRTYQRARQQAMALPRTRKAPPACMCFHACCHVAQNLAVHERLHGRQAVEAAL